MTSQLDRLLASIHPSRTMEETDRRADEGVNQFRMGASLIADWETFRRCLIRFMRHVESHVLGLVPESPKPDDPSISDFDWGRCCQVLMREYGPNGEKAAFEMARTGNDGGLRDVLKRVARSMAKQFTGAEIRAKVKHYWDSLSVDDQLKASDEYLTKHGHLLPSELTEASAARVRANLPKVLEEHPKMLLRLGRVGRTS